MVYVKSAAMVPKAMMSKVAVVPVMTKETAQTQSDPEPRPVPAGATVITRAAVISRAAINHYGIALHVHWLSHINCLGRPRRDYLLDSRRWLRFRNRSRRDGRFRNRFLRL